MQDASAASGKSSTTRTRHGVPLVPLTFTGSSIARETLHRQGIPVDVAAVFFRRTRLTTLPIRHVATPSQVGQEACTIATLSAVDVASTTPDATSTDSGKLAASAGGVASGSRRGL